MVFDAASEVWLKALRVLKTMNRGDMLKAVCILLMVISGAGCAYSQQIARYESSTIKPCDGLDTLSESEIDRRFHAVAAYLDADVGERRAWFGIWTTLLGLGTAGQAVGAGVTDSHATRAALIGGAASTAVATAASIALHPIPLSVLPELNSMPDTNLADKRARLCRAETIFYESAGREAKGLSMKGRIFADLAGLAGGLVGIAYGEVAMGVATMAGSIGGYELQAATRPSRSLSAWLSYSENSAGPLESAWNLGVAPQSVSLSLRF